MQDPKAPVDLSMFRSISERTAKAVPLKAVAATAELSRFIEDPDNPRTEFDAEEFKSLVDDIREHGVLQPVVVVEAGEGRLMIRWGARRLRAARELGLPLLPYVLQSDERQSSEFAQISENEQRAALSPMDLAHFVERMLGKGMKKQDIARRVRKTPADITHLLSLASSSGFILDLYESGKCRQPKLLYDLRRLWERDPRRVQKRCDQHESITRELLDELRDLLAEVESRLSKPEGSMTGEPADKVPCANTNDETGPVARNRVLFQGHPHRFERGWIVLVDEDGTQREIEGAQLAGLLQAVTAEGAAG